jgi:hypothetical protein
MLKLELIHQFQSIHSHSLNPNLVSILFCQNKEGCFVELYFAEDPTLAFQYVLDFIKEDPDFDLDDDDFDDQDFFDSSVDIIDNATLFLRLDSLSISMCVNNFFTLENENLLNS